MSNVPSLPSQPLVSVIIPAYNAETFIERTLRSVLGQTYQNLEVIVVDDGSKDRTTELVKKLATVDSRITLLQQSNSGVAIARNTAIAHARGEFVAPIDADDIWHPQNIEKQVQAILTGGQRVGVVYSWSIDIDEHENLLKRRRASTVQGKVFTTLLLHYFIANASCTLIRRSCIKEVGGYNYTLKQKNAQGCEDWQLYLSIAEKYEFRVVPEYLVGYRQLETSMSRDYRSMAKSQQLVLQAVQERFPKVSTIIPGISQTNLYLYFAHQSNSVRAFENTLFWLKEAILAGSLLALLRPDFYVLLIKAYLRLLTKSLFLREEVCQPVSMVKKTLEVSRSNINIEWSSALTNSTRFKLFAERILHKAAPLIFGTPSSWY